MHNTTGRLLVVVGGFLRMLRLLVGVASGVSAAGADVTTLRGRVGAGWLAVAVGRLSVATAMG